MAINLYYVVTPDNHVHDILAETAEIAIQKAKVKDSYRWNESRYTVLNKRKKYTKKLANAKN